MKNDENVSKQIEVSVIGEKFNDYLKNFDELLEQEAVNENSEIETIRRTLNNELEEHRNRGFLTVAFIGQYSAGKSTIISALTGRNDIHIDTDVATDKTAIYDWNGIKLIDTPGLWTGNHEDHDEITYNAIEKADLLVFCLTHSLFDSLTLGNFKKLAYDRNYRNKMMLVVNKMSQESGEEQQKIINYRDSLEKALDPHQLEEFPLCFIDAEDYREGIEDRDDYLIEVSRFQTFVNELNNFVKNRTTLARLDTPVRITLKWIDKATLSFTRISPQDNSVLNILNNLSVIVDRNRQRLRTDINTVVLKTTANIVKEGNALADEVAVGKEKELKERSELAKKNLQKFHQQAETEIVEILEKSVAKMQQDIQGLKDNLLLKELIKIDDREISKGVHSKITQTKIGSGIALNNFLESLEEASSFLANSGVILFAIGQSAINDDTMNKMSDACKSYAEALYHLSLTQDPSAHAEALSALHTAEKHYRESVPVILHSEHVEGSLLHRTVEGIGHFGESLGIHFDMVDSVGVTEFIGNIGHIVGPIFTVASIASQFKKMSDESAQENQMSKAREDIRKEFNKVATNFEQQSQKKIQSFEVNLHNEIEKQIQNIGKQRKGEMATSNIWIKKLGEISDNFNLILDYIRLNMSFQ
jgi:small GTP-binding protein